MTTTGSHAQRSKKNAKIHIHDGQGFGRPHRSPRTFETCVFAAFPCLLEDSVLIRTRFRIMSVSQFNSLAKVVSNSLVCLAHQSQWRGIFEVGSVAPVTQHQYPSVFLEDAAKVQTSWAQTWSTPNTSDNRPLGPRSLGRTRSACKSLSEERHGLSRSYLHQITKLEATPRVKNCVSKTLNNSP